MSELKTGKIKFFNEEKGFGFIVPGDGTRDIFFHITRCRSSVAELREDAQVEYQEKDGKKGPNAVNVKLL